MARHSVAPPPPAAKAGLPHPAPGHPPPLGHPPVPPPSLDTHLCGAVLGCRPWTPTCGAVLGHPPAHGLPVLDTPPSPGQTGLGHPPGPGQPPSSATTMAVSTARQECACFRCTRPRHTGTRPKARTSTRGVSARDGDGFPVVGVQVQSPRRRWVSSSGCPG